MASEPGPGPVALVHRITIVTALLGALAYTVWAAVERRPVGIAAGLVASAAIAIYLRNLRARLDAKLKPGARA